MAWDTIQASEVDANSPLNQTLFDKIRSNLDYLAGNFICFSGDSPEYELMAGDSTWYAVKSGKIYVPSVVDSLEIAVENMFVEAGVSGRLVRVRVSDGAGGWNNSDTATPGSAGYAWAFLACPAEGSFIGEGGWRDYEVQMRQSTLQPKGAYVRNIIFKVKSIN